MQYQKEDTLAAYMNLTILKFIFLYIITLGFYGFFFQHKFNKALGQLKLEPFAEKARKRFTLMLSLWVIGLVFQFFGAFSESPAADTLGLIISLISSIFGIIWSYDIRAGIRLYCAEKYGINYTANPILVFFFPGLTLTYTVNNIINEVKFNESINTTSGL